MDLLNRHDGIKGYKSVCLPLYNYNQIIISSVTGYISVCLPLHKYDTEDVIAELLTFNRGYGA